MRRPVMTPTARRGVRYGAVSLILLLLLSALLAPATAAAAPRREKPRTKRVQAVGEWAYKRLEKARELLGEEKYAEAAQELDRMKARRSLNDHERALMWQTYGYVQSAQEDYAAAAESFEKCLEKDAMTESAAMNTRYNLGQLYLANDNFDKALKTLLDWYAKTKEPSPDAEYTLATAFVQSGRHAEALPYVKRAIAASSKPKEAWYQLLVSLQFEMKNYQQVADVLEVMVLRFPKRRYWMQLSGIYAETDQEQKSLAALQLAYQQGFLDRHRDLINLAQLYLYNDIPYRAAYILETGIKDKTLEPDAKTWELLATSWIHAKEYNRALEPLRTAAQMSEDGELYVRLAQVHLEREDWVEARQALEAAVRKGGLSDPGDAQLLLGIANYNTKQLTAAKRAFTEARKHDRQRKNADRWLKHIRMEEERSES